MARHRRAADRERRAACAGARSRPAAHLHERRALPAGDGRPPSRRAAVHRHGQGFQRSEAFAVRGAAVLPEDAGRDGGRVRGLSRGAAEHGPDRRTLQRRAARGPEPSAELRRAARLHAGRLLRARGAGRVPAASAAAAAAGAGRHALAHGRRIRAPPRVRDRDDQEDEVPRVLHDRLGFHPLRARTGDSGGARPRIGGREPRRLRAAHHRRRPARLQPDFRTVPEPRARVDARHRHRLLRAAAR